MNKKPVKRSDIVPKKCLWCEEIIDPGRKSNYEYNRITTHLQCTSFYRYYKMPKSMVPVPEDKYCPQCGALIVQREDESDLQFISRSYCNKVCSSRFCNANRKKSVPKPKLPSIEERSGVKRYIPGTPEFDRIAANYL